MKNTNNKQKQLIKVSGTIAAMNKDAVRYALNNYRTALHRKLKIIVIRKPKWGAWNRVPPY